jgi:hypothetical protein
LIFQAPRWYLGPKASRLRIDDRAHRAFEEALRPARDAIARLPPSVDEARPAAAS